VVNGDRVDSIEFLDSDETSIYLVITREDETLFMTTPRTETDDAADADDYFD
jgi:hypothetical protein